MDSKTGFWLRLAAVPGIGPVRFFTLQEHFGDLERVFSASAEEFAKLNGFDHKLAASIHAQLSYLNLDKELELMEKFGVRAITWEQSEYPAMLRNIPYPPPVLYVKGTLVSDELCVSIVGTRQTTSYGRRVAQTLGEGLARAGITVVSGLARGIDGIAQSSALEAGGRSIGVLGCGLTRIYPLEHRRLAERVVQNGAILSEFPMTTPPYAGNFPRRNRIIAGLSKAAVIVEASEKSGALLTADHAVNQGKDVYAVPGPINYPSFRGCHELIKEGARLLEGVEDILEDLGVTAGSAAVKEDWVPKDLSPEQGSIFSMLSADKPTQLDDMIRELGLPAATVNSALIDLELTGYIRQMPGNQFFRSR
jgi:DNA processing protein